MTTMELRLTADRYEALAARAEAAGADPHTLVLAALDDYLARATAEDRPEVRRIGTEYARRQAGLLRRLGE
ncbi:CopG family transcriptional regulator [Streptomyces sp. NPDC058953]|uniref:CopG family transcriptional regulator n=1 Tax=unclassified Streptomyces TaxID=2593676 RepID=UPI0036C46594